MVIYDLYQKINYVDTHKLIPVGTLNLPSDDDPIWEGNPEKSVLLRLRVEDPKLSTFGSIVIYKYKRITMPALDRIIYVYEYDVGVSSPSF